MLPKVVPPCAQQNWVSGMFSSLSFGPLVTRNTICCTVLSFLLPTVVIAKAEAVEQKPCTDAAASLAQKEADKLKDWNSVYRSYQNFGQCDQGSIAEQYSDSVSHLLAHDWKHLDELLRLAASDRKFQQFVSRHIDESMTEDEAERIIRNARTNCPAAARWLCKAIVDY
jgi:hypothetical protein